MTRRFHHPKPTEQMPQTPMETVCRQAADMALEHRALLKPLYTELARCNEKSGVPKPLREEVRSEIAALHRSSASLRAAGQKVDGMVDELSARPHDAWMSHVYANMTFN